MQGKTLVVAVKNKSDGKTQVITFPGIKPDAKPKEVIRALRKVTDGRVMWYSLDE